MVALAGTSARLRSAAGTESVVLVSYLLASPGFELAGVDPLPQVEPLGLLDGLPLEALAAARELERHVVEAVTGLPPGAGPGAVARPGYDPSVTSQAQRFRVKAAELGVTVRTVESYRSRYARQGLAGLVDGRAMRERRVTGRCDARLVAMVGKALDAETGNSTGTRARLQHLAGYTGRNPDRRGDRVEEQAAWTVPDLQDLLDEWLAVWQGRPHDALRDPVFPRRALSPNEKYAALVAAAGYLPVPLSGEDYLELLPVTWRAVNDYGIRIDYRTYDHAGLAPWRRQHSGITARKGLWEVHYDPYDVSRVFVRTPDGWVTAPWTHLPMVSAPFADFTWRRARDLAAARGLDGADESAVARVLDDLLTRAQAGPGDRASARVAARTAIAAADRPCPPPAEGTRACDSDGQAAPEPDGRQPAVTMGIFDARAEAEKWL